MTAVREIQIVEIRATLKTLRLSTSCVCCKKKKKNTSIQYIPFEKVAKMRIVECGLHYIFLHQCVKICVS